MASIGRLTRKQGQSGQIGQQKMYYMSNGICKEMPGDSGASSAAFKIRAWSLLSCVFAFLGIGLLLCLWQAGFVG